MPNENDNKLVTLADLAEAYNVLYNRDVVTTATQSTNGLMSSVDKTKLDGIAAGAQVNSVTSVNNQTGAVSITPANIGAASDSAAMQYRGWYPNGQSMLSLTPGYYRTSPNNLPSETFPSGISFYGTLCVDNTGYTRITYISVLGDFMIWKSNSTSAQWYVLQKEGKAPVSSGGTGATTPNGACANIGAVKKSGDTMTGSLIIQKTDGRLYFEDNEGNRVGYIAPASDGSMRVLEYNGSNDHYEVYNFPRPTATSGTSYSVLTTKSVVTIPQGGTGATTAADARANLGLNDIGTTQAQSAITPVNDNQLRQINVTKDCWVCASFHITANTDGGIVMTRNGIPVINDVQSNGPCNYWANAQFPCKTNALLQYKLNSNATDSSIYFLTV